MTSASFTRQASRYEGTCDPSGKEDLMRPKVIVTGAGRLAALAIAGALLAGGTATPRRTGSSASAPARVARPSRPR